MLPMPSWKILSAGGIGGACVFGGIILQCHQSDLRLSVHPVSDRTFLRGWQQTADSMRRRQLLKNDGEAHMRSMRGRDIPEWDGSVELQAMQPYNIAGPVLPTGGVSASTVSQGSTEQSGLRGDDQPGRLHCVLGRYVLSDRV